MGYEYGIILKNGEYTKAIKALTEAFQSFSEQWVVEGGENGFSLLCPVDEKWPDRLQVNIQTAGKHDGIVPEGSLYLLFCSYLDGKERQRALDCIESALIRLGYAYEMDDL